LASAGRLIDEARERAYPGREAVAVNEAVSSQHLCAQTISNDGAGNTHAHTPATMIELRGSSAMWTRIAPGDARISSMSSRRLATNKNTNAAAVPGAIFNRQADDSAIRPPQARERRGAAWRGLLARGQACGRRGSVTP
jgi:hypothetical protein